MERGRLVGVMTSSDERNSLDDAELRCFAVVGVLFFGSLTAKPGPLYLILDFLTNPGRSFVRRCG